MNGLKEFIFLSKYAGERFDLVQAGGGNSSVKLDDGTMLIKASGYLLSDVEVTKGFARVNNQEVLAILENQELLNIEDKRKRDELAGNLVKDTVMGSRNRPSIETFLHSLLYKYTLHTHPLVVNALTCKKNWQEILKSLFNNVLLVGYKTPGVELALELKKAVLDYQNDNNRKPKIIFLQSHGLIISSDDYEEVKTLTEEVLVKIEDFLETDMSKYKLTTKISSMVNYSEDSSLISYLSEDLEINNLLKIQRDFFFNLPFCPDGQVYCGIKAFELTSLDGKAEIKEYQAKFHELPRVIIYQDKLFFIAQNLKKAKEMEDVFKFQVMVLNLAGDNVNSLTMEELAYLGNWEAEKYRQKL